MGGGTIIVPLLILWFAYGEREATGTSLAAIVVIAALAAAGQGAYGNVDVVKGLAIGIPAVGGVLAGTALQQRVPQRFVSYLFAALLVAVAVELLSSDGHRCSSSCSASPEASSAAWSAWAAASSSCPALAIFLDEPQVEAEATSLLAIVIVAIAGTIRQHRYGNVRLGDAGVIGATSVAGVALGVVVSNAVSERTLEVGFAIARAGDRGAAGASGVAAAQA